MSGYLVMAMSLRRESLNKKLAKNVVRILNDLSLENPDLLEFNDFPLPIYSGDIEDKDGVPKPAAQLADRIRSAQGLILSTPEYNGGVPGAFKNAMDWVSRIKPMPWSGKHILLLGASPGALGAVRGLWHSRVPLEAMGAFVYPEMFGLPKAHEAFDEQAQLKDPDMTKRLRRLLEQFVATVAARV